MNPFFFGPSAKQLYGAYFPPPDAADSGKGIIICQPIWQEYVRSRWACVHLARALSRRGFHAMLFDYFATGDSAGESDEGSVRGWIDNIVTAARELADMTGVAAIGVIGARFGAALACGACMENGIRPFAIGLWDPVISGRQYVSDITAFHDALAASNKHIRPSAGGSLVGFPAPRGLLNEIIALNTFDFFKNQQIPFYMAYSEQTEEIKTALDLGKTSPGFRGSYFAPDECGRMSLKNFDRIMPPRTISENLISFFSGTIA